ncbi:MAG: ferritin family protein [Candidatus Aureabacteria bacterium]|nr:ferritin family protein [Candidatus Auribacterota bacterium]
MRIEDKGGSLVIVDFDELEAYKIASKIERDGIEFYTKLAGRVAKRKPRGALELLATQERDHLDFFHQQLSRLRQVKEDNFEEDDLLSSIDYKIFQPYQGIAELEKILDTPRKALRLGVIVEEKSIDFYEFCIKKVTSPEAQAEIARIIEEERQHKKTLEDMIAELS